MAEQKSLWKSLWTKPMLVTLLFGFSSGLPLLLTLRTLQAWMTEAGVDLKTIGIFSLAGLPYTLKFIWAPFMDRFSIPFLGRRRGWLIITQIGLILALAMMAFNDPKERTFEMALLTLLVSFFSASQDIVVDAYRRETLPDEDLGIGSTFYIYGYRVAMWFSGGFALVLAQHTTWTSVYLTMSGLMLIGIATALWAPEPTLESAPPKSLREAVIDPFTEFLKRRGALMIVVFILLYKVGDNIAGNMLTPFYLKMGYNKEEIGWIAKTLSLPFSLFGSFLGGVIIHKIGINSSLWIFGIFQAISTFFFSALTMVDHNLWVLGSVICFEDISTSMGSAAFVAFMASMANKKYTATQYALLSALMRIPSTIISAPAGILAESLGWFGFFSFGALTAIPGLIMIRWMIKLQKQNGE